MDSWNTFLFWGIGMAILAWLVNIFISTPRKSNKLADRDSHNRFRGFSELPYSRDEEIPVGNISKSFNGIIIHFAFGSLKENPDQQITNLLKFIIKPKRLRFSKNPEFIPEFRSPNTMSLSLESFKPTKTGVIAKIENFKFENYKYDIYYAPVPISMICFIKISIEQLGKSSHSREYGKLGLVFDKDYLRKNRISPVIYYTEESLYSDLLIYQWNIYKKSNPTPYEQKIIKELRTQILAYRKPAKLFKSFSESRVLALDFKKSVVINTNIENVYDRYPIGYDFQSEQEWRIVSEDNQEFMEFEEKDLKSIIVSNEQSKVTLEEYFRNEWEVVPEILIFPEDKARL